MRVPLSWLREYVDLPAGTVARDVADALIRAGFEVESIDEPGADIVGPVVIGRVLEIEELAGFSKPIRYCQVDVGEPAPRGIVCGASNFAVGDRIVASLPGAVLPGGFAIAARQTYGKISDGMICSVRELGVGEDHSGILVLPPHVAGDPGADAIDPLGLREVVLDLDVTPDRGYAESIRGIAREVSHAFGTAYRDPAGVAARAVSAGSPAAPDRQPGAGWPARIADPTGCDRLALQTVTGLAAAAPSPLWLQRRLTQCGIRAISLVVDVTNYVMLELGQPLHAYDASRVRGTVEVRRARKGERLRTLDGVQRDLLETDVLVTDDSGPIGLAGVMGGGSTEIDGGSTEIVLEAAHFDPASVGRTLRRHKLPSEASKRFERHVDPEVAGPALDRAAQLLAELGGAAAGGRTTLIESGPVATVRIDVGLPGRIAGVDYQAAAVIERLREIGCTVEGIDELTVTPASWRPDLRDPADLVEEVVRLSGIENIPSTLPSTPPGRGLTAAQRSHRSIARALADAGYVEVVPFPFVGVAALDALDLPIDDARRRTLTVVNPLADTDPLLRTTLLPGLLAALRRNVGRGFADVALYELGLVFLPGSGTSTAPLPGVGRAPDPEVLQAMDAALPEQPRHVGVVLCGDREMRGPGVSPRPGDWTDAIAAARLVADVCRVGISVEAADQAPWHPGRCAAIEVGGAVAGYAGELHPRVVAALELPARTCAVELDLEVLGRVDLPVVAVPISTYPAALLDIALVADEATPQVAVEDALRSGAGALLESLQLFDVYRGERVGAGRKSLAYALRLRAVDRTLTADELTAVRDRAVAAAAAAVGAVLRG